MLKDSLLMQACVYSYEPLKKNLKGLKHISVDNVEVKNQFASVIMVDKDTMIIAIRGSDDIADGITDVKATKTDFLGLGEAHEGFVNGYDLLKNDVNKAIKSKKPKTIYCTGHSMGSAISTLFALDLRIKAWRQDVHLVTFASPRVLSKDLAKIFNKFYYQHFATCKRYFIFEDAVPLLPLHSMGFAHANRGIMIKQDGSQKVMNSFDDLLLYRIRHFGKYIKSLFVRNDASPIAVHHYTHYLEVMKGLDQ